MSDDWLETDNPTSRRLQATELQGLLNQIDELADEQFSDNHQDEIEAIVREIITNGEMTTDKTTTITKDLSITERLGGTATIDVTSVLLLGMSLGTAFERDIPQDSDTETKWRRGKMELPDY